MLSARLPTGGIRREAWILLSGNFLGNIGLGLFFPILPLFVTGRGGSPALVGIIGASALFGNVLAQTPGGWLADRYSRRLLVILSNLAYGLFFLVYLVPLPVVALIAVRFLHAAAGGVYQPAARALLADLTPADRRGVAFGQWQASNMGGFLIGPLLGGLLASFSLRYVFIGAAAACVLSSALCTTLPEVRRNLEHAVPSGVLPIGSRRLFALLAPASVAGAAWGWMNGAYGSAWSLYMVSLGGGPFAIGLSISLFSLPVVLLSGLSGQLQDRIGPRLIVGSSLFFGGLFATFYALTQSVPLVIGLGLIEGICTVGGMPAAMAEISRLADSSQQGRAQGIFSTFNVAAQAGAALAAGFLFQVSHSLPFLSITAACWLALLAAPFIGRRAPARAEPASAPV